MDKPMSPLRAAKLLICAVLYVTLVISCLTQRLLAQKSKARPVVTTKQSRIGAAALLKQGTTYQAVDDISDRAADFYRLVLQKYPDSPESERAQFYLASYYQKKFFILDQTNHVQDWSAFNEAESALYAYVGKYARNGAGSYLGDAYHTLAIISLRRGYIDNARRQLAEMRNVASRDGSVYIYTLVWSRNAADVVDKNCNTAVLASGTLENIRSPFDFDRFVRDLRTWCRQHCR
jgi:hypothetical protein